MILHKILRWIKTTCLKSTERLIHKVPTTLTSKQLCLLSGKWALSWVSFRFRCIYVRFPFHNSFRNRLDKEGRPTNVALFDRIRQASNCKLLVTDVMQVYGPNKITVGDFWTNTTKWADSKGREESKRKRTWLHSWMAHIHGMFDQQFLTLYPARRPIVILLFIYLFIYYFFHSLFILFV